VSKKTGHDDTAPIGQVTRVADMLPPPSELVPRDDSVKVTLSLSAESVDFFKEAAKRNNVPYQRMIRNLVDQYVHQHSGH
jgi:predicted DNA binding CopG/RHH family protein